MKKILLLIPILALATGCFKEDLDVIGASGDGVTLTVRVDVPAPQTRQAISEGDIESLWLMVFNQNGTYLGRYQGALTGGSNNFSDYTFTGIPVSNDSSGNPRSRTLHFVANYDWSGFNDVDRIGDSESTLLPRMTVEGGQTAYWQRLVLVDGFDEPNTIMSLPGGPVHLLRNIAQVTVVNETGNKLLKLADVQFVIGNYFDKGSVAPYNPTTGVFGTGFGDTFVMEALDGVPVNTIDENDFVPATTLEQVYERRNSTARQPTYVIVRGHFDGASAWSYYKIDIVNNDDRELIDLQRNMQYTININEVSNDGHDNLRDAMDGAASNNVNASIIEGAFPSISDGTNVLEVQATSFTYMESDYEFEIWYRYTTYDALGNGTVNNVLDGDPLLEQTPGRLVVAEGSLTAENGVIRGRTATLPVNGVYEARITISKGILSRSINLQFRPIMGFTILSPVPRGSVNNIVGAPASITFKLPDNISERLFPLPVRIYTKKLMPATESGLTIEYGNGDFWYVYNAPYLLDGNNNQAAHTLNFVSTTTLTEEVVALSADRFDSAYVTFGPYKFIDAGYNPTSVPRRTAEPVDLNFKIPSGYWAENNQCVVNFNTSTLQPLAGNPSGLVTVSANNYQLTVAKPAVAGDVAVTARFQSVNRNSAISTIISATDISTATITAPRGDLWNFVDTYMSPKQRITAGNTADMTVSFSLEEGSVSASEPLNIRFSASYLTLRDANGLNITTAGSNGTMVMTINGLTTVGPHTFTVRNNGSPSQTYRNQAKTFTEVGGSFSTSEDINAAWEFINPSMDPKPRNVGTNSGSTSVDIVVRFTVPQGSASPSQPLTVTLATTYSTLQDDKRTPGLNVTQSSSATSRTYTISNITAPGEYYFTIRKSRTNNNTSSMTLSAPGFNNSANLNGA